jgi:hypothetical protein
LTPFDLVIFYAEVFPPKKAWIKQAFRWILSLLPIALALMAANLSIRSPMATSTNTFLLNTVKWLASVSSVLGVMAEAVVDAPVNGIWRMSSLVDSIVCRSSLPLSTPSWAVMPLSQPISKRLTQVRSPVTLGVGYKAF